MCFLRGWHSAESKLSTWRSSSRLSSCSSWGSAPAESCDAGCRNPPARCTRPIANPLFPVGSAWFPIRGTSKTRLSRISEWPFINARIGSQVGPAWFPSGSHEKWFPFRPILRGSGPDISFWAYRWNSWVERYVAFFSAHPFLEPVPIVPRLIDFGFTRRALVPVRLALVGDRRKKSACWRRTCSVTLVDELLAALVLATISGKTGSP